MALKDTGLVLTTWTAIGPWEARAGQSALDVDFLQLCGQTEDGLTAAGLAAMLRPAASGSAGSRPLQAEFADFGECFGVRPARGLPESAGYAACEIEAERDRDAWLLLGSDARVRLWLNGIERYASRAPRSLKEYDDAIALPLRRGANLLLIKAVNTDPYWTVTARLEPTRDSAARTALTLSDGFFRRALVAPGAPVEVFVRGLPASTQWEAELETYEGKPIRALRVGPEVPVETTDLAEGLYRLVVKQGGPWSRPVFYVGSFDGLYRAMEARCAGLTGEDRVAINLHALQRRLEILAGAEQAARVRPENPEWARRALAEDNEYKAVYAATELEDALARIARHEEPFRNRPGLHLRGFRSRIDDQPMYYRVYVPSSYRPEGPGLPLFIMPQPVTTANRPFLESAFVARQREAEQWARAAEKLGMAILWPGYRVRSYGNPIDFTHFEEALAAVRADYRIDPTRLYLHAYCSTGLFTAMEVVRHPCRYAAVAMVNPVLHRLKGRYDEREDFPRLPQYQAWLRETDPMEAFGSLRELPLWIIHDDVDPDHGPLSHTIELVERLRAIGGRPRFQRYDPPPPGPLRFRLMEQQLAWLCRQRRPDASEETSQKDHPVSVAEALSERFLVVRGTCGPAGARAQVDRWAQDFAAGWKRTTFGPCRMVDDVQLREADEKESNLVLIGNAETNAAWKQLAASLPLKMTRESVEIAGRAYRGRDLSLQAVLPHPVYPGRKLLFIGSAHLATALPGTEELALDGWFGQAIWRDESGHARLLDARRDGGRFK